MLASARRLSHKRLFSFKPRGAVKTAPYKAGVNSRLQGRMFASTRGRLL